jgi:hypothetical protein
MRRGGRHVTLRLSIDRFEGDKKQIAILITASGAARVAWPIRSPQGAERAAGVKSEHSRAGTILDRSAGIGRPGWATPLREPWSHSVSRDHIDELAALARLADALMDAMAGAAPARCHALMVRLKTLADGARIA